MVLTPHGRHFPTRKAITLLPAISVFGNVNNLLRVNCHELTESQMEIPCQVEEGEGLIQACVWWRQLSTVNEWRSAGITACAELSSLPFLTPPSALLHLKSTVLGSQGLVCGHFNRCSCKITFTEHWARKLFLFWGLWVECSARKKRKWCTLYIFRKTAMLLRCFC